MEKNVAVTDRPCPECGGQRVGVWCSRPMEVADKPHFAHHKSLLKAVLCTQCGLTTLYAAKPHIFQKEADEWYLSDIW